MWKMLPMVRLVSEADIGATICAERTAILKKVTSAEHRKKCIVAVAVTSDAPTPCTPCGMCRQVLREFCSQDMPLLMPPQEWSASGTPGDLAENDVLTTTLAELLPLSFGPDVLRIESNS